MFNTVSLDNNGLNKNKKSSPLKTMLERMKSNNLVNNLSNNVKSQD